MADEEDDFMCEDDEDYDLVSQGQHIVSVSYFIKGSNARITDYQSAFSTSIRFAMMYHALSQEIDVIEFILVMYITVWYCTC